MCYLLFKKTGLDLTKLLNVKCNLLNIYYETEEVALLLSVTLHSYG